MSIDFGTRHTYSCFYMNSFTSWTTKKYFLNFWEREARFCGYKSRYPYNFSVVIKICWYLSVLRTCYHCIKIEEILNGKLHFFCSVLHVNLWIYLFKVSNGNTRTMCRICLKLIIINTRTTLVALLLTLNRFHALVSWFHFLLRTSKPRLGNNHCAYSHLEWGVDVKENKKQTIYQFERSNLSFPCR